MSAPMDVDARARPARRRASPILAAVHESIRGLHLAGAVDLETVREFDALCRSPLARSRREGATASTEVPGDL